MAGVPVACLSPLSRSPTGCYGDIRGITDGGSGGLRSPAEWPVVHPLPGRGRELLANPEAPERHERSLRPLLLGRILRCLVFY
jgi:hypothetical protein